jgi:hypothetical protein
VRRANEAFCLFALACSACQASPTPSKSSSSTDAGVLDSSTPQTSCSDDAGTCFGRVTVSGSFTLPYLGTALLDTPNAALTDLVVFIEGLDRDAANDFATIVAAGQSANALDHTLIVTPEFQALQDGDGGACPGHVDTPVPTDLVWTCEGWSDGLFATNDPTASSYGALDALVAQALAGQTSIVRVTIAGFSAGGQFTQRYVAANRADGQPGGPAFRYVVGDPSSYVYFSALRPVNASSCTLSACPDGFAPFADGACPSFDDWKYGTEALGGAAASFAASELESAYVARPVTYLLGTLDDGPTTAADYAQLDVTCPAEAQGPYRYQRGVAYFNYASGPLGASKQTAFDVPGCAHSPSCVFRSDAGVAAVFGP